jgi:large subunit ribosomal protein L6
MSRVAKRPVDLPAGVTATVAANTIKVKGAKGELTLVVADGVSVQQKEKTLVCAYASDASRMSAGAARAHLANMVTGVSKGYERKLELVGVGYRAAVQGKVLGLTLGFSHAVNFPIPDGIEMQTPTQTEIIIKGIDRQKIGQVCAKIRAIRPPEPYKGKGVRYSGEQITLKEGKKK